jgi:hypothetical protein
VPVFVRGAVPPAGLAPPAGRAACAGLAGAEGLDGALGALFFCAETKSGRTIRANRKNAIVAGYLKMWVGFTLSPWHLEIFL